MKLTQAKLEAAVLAKILNPTQAKELWHFLETQEESNFSLVNLCFYLGGMIAIISITMLLSPYIMQLGGWWLPLVLSIYLILAFVSTHYFRQQNYPIPAALSLLFAIGVFPLWASSLSQVILNQGSILSLVAIFTQENFNYLLATLIFSFILLFVYQYPLLLPAILIQFWYILYQLLPNQGLSFTAILFAIICIALAQGLKPWLQDKHYLKWLNSLGCLSLWIGLIFELNQFNEWLWLGFLGINLFFLFIGIKQEEKLFHVLAVIGIIIYLSHFIHLLFTTWQIPWILAFTILSFIGIILLRLGVYLHQKQKKTPANND